MVVVIIYVRFWEIQCECVMLFILRREYPWDNGSSRDFGTKGN